MAKMTLEEVSEKMRDIDFAILSTRTEGGSVAGRSMSNNREVEFDGDSFFFTCEDTRTVADIRRDPNVGLGYQSKSGMLHLKPFFLTVEGRASLIEVPHPTRGSRHRRGCRRAPETAAGPAREIRAAVRCAGSWPIARRGRRGRR